MHDEATTHYVVLELPPPIWCSCAPTHVLSFISNPSQDMIDQTTLGHEFLIGIYDMWHYLSHCNNLTLLSTALFLTYLEPQILT